MQLSVIIVNYQVRLFLEQCLCSLRLALQGIDAEIWVVDNASTDGSITYLQPLFPEVRFLPQSVNLGYGPANNLALKHCRGEYILLLNPDTLVPAPTIRESIRYMQAHPACGAAGVRMIDGNGHYLPESKRSFPGPWVSFAKLSGLSALFPKSGIINRYAAGQLNETCIQPVEVLAGAYILAQRSVLEAAGGFNEAYFLYGEDIDLSMRIRKAGYENHYLGHLTILHFKGESTNSLGQKRIYYFYQAMRIFVQDYYPASTAKMLNGILLPAIRLRQALAQLGNLLKPFRSLVTDAILLLILFWLVQTGWIQMVRGGKPFGIPFARYAILLYTACTIAAAAFAGLYQRNITNRRVVAAAVFSLLTLLAAYSLLPETLRFSRGVVLIGSLAGMATLVGWRRIWLKIPGTQTAVICTEEAYAGVTALLKDNLVTAQACLRVSPGEIQNRQESFLTQLKVHGIGMVIISLSGNYPLDQAITLLPILHNNGHRVLWHHANSGGFIGSEPLVAGAGDVAPSLPYPLNDPYQRFMKRLLDVCRAGFVFIGAPYFLLSGAKGRQQLDHAWLVLSGRYTYTGYLQPHPALPPLKPGIRPHTIRPENDDPASVLLADRQYAAGYNWWKELVLSLQ